MKIIGGKVIVTSGERAAHIDTLADNEEVGLHERVVGGEDRQHISIKLKAKEHNEHSCKIGKEETRELWDADMVAKEFPDKIHRWMIWS